MRYKAVDLENSSAEDAERLVLCHIGDLRQARALLDCVQFHRNRYAGLSIDLVVSETPNPSFLSAFDSSKVNVVEIGSDRFSDEHRAFRLLNWFNRDFRFGFWSATTERFFYLLDYFQLTGISRVVHIEYDVALFEHPASLWLCIPDAIEFAVPLSNSRAVASVVLIKGESALRSLCQQVLRDRPLNDMVGLDLFYRAHTEIVLALPTVPPHVLGKNDLLAGRLSNSFDLFGAIFDAAAIGQYFFGIDPLNSMDKMEAKFVNEDTSFPLVGSNLSWLIGPNGHSPVISVGEFTYRVVNIHIHSKNFNEVCI